MSTHSTQQPSADTISGPVKSADRIRALDVLRGFALLGILVPNIQAYSMISIAYRNPTTYGDFSGANFAVWFTTYLLFEQKFMTIFSVLFGAGIVLMANRASVSGRSPAALHYRRMGWLLLFGLAHAHLLWFGDILFAYAVCGMAAYCLHKLKPIWLLLTGLLLLTLGSALFLLSGWSMQFWPESQVAEMSKDWTPSPEKVEKELATYRGSWLSQLPLRSQTAFMFETFLLLFIWIWRAGGLMLIGMALYKWKIITGERSNRFYGTAAVAGLVIGLPLVIYEIHQNVACDFDIKYSFFFGTLINYWVSLLVSLAYLSIIMLMCRAQILKWLQTSLAAIGQMALSNYIAHSVICTTLFYGHGFGYFGYLQRTEQIMVVVSIWVLQLVISPLWLKKFRFGPLEWLWRSLVYWKRQPMLRTTTASATKN